MRKVFEIRELTETEKESVREVSTEGGTLKNLSRVLRLQEGEQFALEVFPNAYRVFLESDFCQMFVSENGCERIRIISRVTNGGYEHEA